MLITFDYRDGYFVPRGVVGFGKIMEIREFNDTCAVQNNQRIFPKLFKLPNHGLLPAHPSF